MIFFVLLMGTKDLFTVRAKNILDTEFLVVDK